jgi:hypothetical protein
MPETEVSQGCDAAVRRTILLACHALVDPTSQEGRTIAVTATSCYKAKDVSLQQERAIEVLVAGGTHGRAAEAAGCHRVTVTRWANYDPDFIAEINRRRAEVWTEVADQLQRAVRRSVEVVVAALEGPEPSLPAALAILRMGAFDSLMRAVPVGGPTTAAEVLDMEAARRADDPKTPLVAVQRPRVAAEWKQRLEEPIDVDRAAQ